MTQLTHQSPEMATAIAAVVAASQLCQNVRASLTQDQSMTKDDRSPVTVADFGAQAVVLAALANAFPQDPVVAEEDAAELMDPSNASLKTRVVSAVQAIDPQANESSVMAAIDRGQHQGGATGRFWTLDPIDGTKGFLRNDQYAVALALIVDGQPVLGVLGCPALPLDATSTNSTNGCLLSAVQGAGALLLNAKGETIRKISVSEQNQAANASFCESVESGHSRHDWSAQVAESLDISNPSVRMDSQCKYAAIARGDAEIYLRLPTRPGYQEKIWDHAAGAICVTEAGGQVSDITGKPLDFSKGATLADNSGVIATNGRFHSQVVDAVQKHQP